MTPMALTAWIFDSYRHLFDKWWKNIKQLSLMQITYALFICILGILIFGTRNIVPNDPTTIIVKLMVIAGGLWRLANPPSFVLVAGDNGKDVWSIGKELFNTFTFKKFIPVEFYKAEIKPRLDKYRNEKLEDMRVIRKLTGKRYNK
jgi:hypothetical protein